MTEMNKEVIGNSGFKIIKKTMKKINYLDILLYYH